MIKNNTSAPRVVAQARRYCLCLFLFMSTLASAAENRLGTSLTVQQDQDTNYVMRSDDQQTLSGSYLKPTLGYSHDNGVEKFSVDIQESIERFNRSEYNVNNPTYSVNYKRAMERSTLSFGYDAMRQSTRVSELKDSGNIGTTNQQINTASGSWQYQVSLRNIFSVNGSLQNTKYESNSYADFKNKSLQLVWQTDFSDRLSYYTVLSGTGYESQSSGFFFLVPKRVQGYLLCPPNSNLASEASCYLTAGNAANETTSSGMQTGIKWNAQEQLKLSLNAGFTYIDTEQTITMPELSVQYGSPIDQDVILGGGDPRGTNQS